MLLWPASEILSLVIGPVLCGLEAPLLRSADEDDFGLVLGPESPSLLEVALDLWVGLWDGCIFDRRGNLGVPEGALEPQIHSIFF